MYGDKDTEKLSRRILEHRFAPCFPVAALYNNRNEVRHF